MVHKIVRSHWWLFLLIVLAACQIAPSPQPTATPVPAPTLLPEPRLGRPVKGDDGAVYRLMENNHLRHINDLLTLSALAYDWHDIVNIPQSELASYEADPPLTRWLTGVTDTDLYYLQRGVRYKITDRDMLLTTGGTPQDVTQVDDAFLHNFPLSDLPLEGADLPIKNTAHTTPEINTSYWQADSNYYDIASMRYHVGRGLIALNADNTESVLTLDDGANDPLKYVTAIQQDTWHQKLWVGTRFAGLLAYDLVRKTWQRYSSLTSKLKEDHINAISAAQDGSVWLAGSSGVTHFDGTEAQTFGIPNDIAPTGALAVAVGKDGVWASGENFIGKLDADGKWQVYSGFDHPLLLDRFSVIQLDSQGNPLAFLGDQRQINYINGKWEAKDFASGNTTAFDPTNPKLADIPNFPDPTKDYAGWLKTWPRPEHDNGRGIHYLAFPSGDRFELHQQVQRLKRLNIRWLLVNYTSRSQLLQMAPVFKQAGIMVIWRPWVRPYVEYPYWKQDVTFLRALGVAPYIQIYNEPSLGQEWEDKGIPIDQALYLKHLIPAMRAVFDAGGYVGLQHIDLEWLRATLKRMKTEKMLDILPRMFFIPHAYGYNHPPDYDDDENSVLGFRFFAQVFQQEIGFMPMMIAGEGGWRPDEMQDIRYPMVTQTRYRDYIVAALTWFQTGKLSNGDPLPDYFFALCPWILSDPNDRAAWFDSVQGNRELIIQAVQNLPEFERHFSWEKGDSDSK